MMGLSHSLRRLGRVATPHGAGLLAVLLLVCLVGIAVTECHMATSGLDHQHARPIRHPHSAPGHASVDVHCLVAILSAGVFAYYLLAVVLVVTPEWLPSMEPVFPLFKPPRHGTPR